MIAILLYNKAERETVEGVIHRMVKRAVEMEGTVTGEHGVGLIKRDYLPHELGESTVDAMRRVSFLSCLFVSLFLFTFFVPIHPIFCKNETKKAT